MDALGVSSSDLLLTQALLLLNKQFNETVKCRNRFIPLTRLSMEIM